VVRLRAGGGRQKTGDAVVWASMVRSDSAERTWRAGAMLPRLVRKHVRETPKHASPNDGEAWHPSRVSHGGLYLLPGNLRNGPKSPWRSRRGPYGAGGEVHHGFVQNEAKSDVWLTLRKANGYDDSGGTSLVETNPTALGPMEAVATGRAGTVSRSTASGYSPRIHNDAAKRAQSPDPRHRDTVPVSQAARTVRRGSRGVP
jgi:hypothetical protein